MNVVRVCVCELKICALKKKKVMRAKQEFLYALCYLEIARKELATSIFVVARAMVRERTTTKKSCSLLKSVQLPS